MIAFNPRASTIKSISLQKSFYGMTTIEQVKELAKRRDALRRYL